MSPMTKTGSANQNSLIQSSVIMSIPQPTACQTSCARLQLWHAPGVRCATQTLISERDWSDRKCIMCSKRRRYPRTRARRSHHHRKSRVSRVSKSRRRLAIRRAMKINKAKTTCESPVHFERQHPDATSKSRVDQESTRYPDSSRASLSSYNSYLSESHEPMVFE